MLQEDKTMIVETKNELGKSEKWAVKWAHNKAETKCEIFSVEEQDEKVKLIPFTEAYSFLSCKDRYCKNTGRKISMKRALESFGKSSRKRFWAKYNEMRNGRW